MERNMLRAPLIKTAALLAVVSLLVYLTATSARREPLELTWNVIDGNVKNGSVESWSDRIFIFLSGVVDWHRFGLCSGSFQEECVEHG